MAHGGDRRHTVRADGAMEYDTVQNAPVSGRTQQQPAEYDTLLHQAYSFYNQGSYEQAIALCRQCHSLAPSRTDCLLLMGAAHFQLKQFEQCMEVNRKALRIDPSFAEAHGNLGNALKEVGRVQEAMQCYGTAIQLRPYFVDPYTNLANVYIALGQHASALQTYVSALSRVPHHVDTRIHMGNLLKSMGRQEEAKQCFLEVVRLAPQHAGAWSAIAGIYLDQGDAKNAIFYYNETLKLDSTLPDVHSNLGNAYKMAGQLEAAKASYKAALALKPDFAIAIGNLGSVYYEEADMQTAITTYRRALELMPNFPDVYNNLGNALRETGQHEEALECYNATLRLKPDHPHAYNNLGNAMKDRGRITEAMRCYSMACKLMPNFAAAHSNLACVLKDQGDVRGALTHYLRAIRIDPNFADAYSNLGNLYKDSGNLDKAIECYSTAIRLKPYFADAYSNLAGAYKDGGKIAEAIDNYRAALRLRPQFPDAFSNLVHSLVFICDWSNRSEDFRKLDEMTQQQLRTPGQLPSVQPFHALVYPVTLKQALDISERYAERAALTAAALGLPAFQFEELRAQCRAAPQSRIRLAYVSSDFGNHPLAHLMSSVFCLHDRSRFEVTCYALSPPDGSVWRRKISQGVEHFVDVSQLSVQQIAQRIAADGIQVLINLNGYTKGARNEVFALRPAPVQVGYMGFCGTMGADFIDYMVSDHSVVPDEATPYYTEHQIFMPHSYFVNDHRQSARDVLDPAANPSRSRYGIPEDKFVFCNFNQIYKIDPATFARWARILHRVPNSVLWLLRFPALGESNIRAAAKRHGLSEDRIIFTDVASKDEHIRRGALPDLFLDTPVCNAHTTGCDILWGGTPMLTLVGEKMASRVAASLLRAAGLPELITSTEDEYERLAVRLATEEGLLSSLRDRLGRTRDTSALFDTERWVRSMEGAMVLARARWLEGKAPARIDAPDTPTCPLREDNALLFSASANVQQAAQQAAQAAAVAAQQAAHAAGQASQTAVGWQAFTQQQEQQLQQQQQQQYQHQHQHQQQYVPSFGAAAGVAPFSMPHATALSGIPSEVSMPIHPAFRVEVPTPEEAKYELERRKDQDRGTTHNHRGTSLHSSPPLATPTAGTASSAALADAARGRDVRGDSVPGAPRGVGGAGEAGTPVTRKRTRGSHSVSAPSAATTWASSSSWSGFPDASSGHKREPDS